MPGNPALTRRHTALAARARIIQSIREFFIKGGYLEVETPLRIPAPAPESHIDAIPSDGWFLHTSPEICMKRLLSAGFDRIFQICRCWRGGERGSKHLPEFTMLEWYRTHADYHDLMDDCEALLRSVADACGLGNSVYSFRGNEVNLAGSWERITVKEAFRRYATISVNEAMERDIFDEVMVTDIEPRLGLVTPTFLTDYPAERSALARLRTDDPTVAERFELYIGGLELANAFSELTDPLEQRSRFIEEAAYRARTMRLPYPLPEHFLEELDGMPPSAGIALGVDRLVMVMLDAKEIDDIVAFTPETL